MPSLGSQFVFNDAGNYAPRSWPGGTGFQFGGGRENAIGSSGSGSFYTGQPGIFSRGLTGIGMLLGRLAGSIGNLVGGNNPAQPSNGVTPSAGGWAIDKNGNLIDNSSSSAPQQRSGPNPISHTTAIPGWAAAALAETMKRNQL